MSRASKQRRKIWKIDEGRKRRKTDFLAVEEPLEIQLGAGGQTQTVAITMRTPGDDFELAAGFLYGEGVLSAREQIDAMRYCVDTAETEQNYNVLKISLRAKQLPELATLERHFFTNSACGVCGKAVLDMLEGHQRPVPPMDAKIQQETLFTLPDTLRQAQSIFEETGGLHAAALFDLDGQLLAVREDVGRHNALDKLIGWALSHDRLPLSQNIIMVSGRASYELLQKCLYAGAPIFCAVSAPSSLAVSVAQKFGITLVGFLRQERANLYTYPERVVTERVDEAKEPMPSKMSRISN